MPQTTDGLRAVLSNPYIYSFLQSLFGARRSRINFVNKYVKPFPNIKILDVGCGPADILEFLPESQYWGYDISEPYISQARSRFKNHGQFYCKQLQAYDLLKLPKFDVVFALGLIHHLDDPTATNVIQLCHDALAEGGRLVTIDPCLVRFQNPIARFLIRHDRGQNVRNQLEYEMLVKSIFPKTNTSIQHQTWIPYTHCIMESFK